mmetsp:Transcript_6672/g.9223  ORF Transcript_6672/g.9223 Transcript_6672/m.9223 type:complete len:93 (-) Transcript_6672:1537-1815(-)
MDRSAPGFLRGRRAKAGAKVTVSLYEEANEFKRLSDPSSNEMKEERKFNSEVRKRCMEKLKWEFNKDSRSRANAPQTDRRSLDRWMSKESST